MFRGRKSKKIALLLVPILVLLIVAGWYLYKTNIPVLEPAGQVGSKERELIFIAIALSVIVVVPVYIMTITIAWKYRASNAKAKYQPDWDHSRLYEGLWWGIPLVIITILSIITWQSSHTLDPYKALAASNSPLTIQVIAMDWKWLFIYPNQHVASVNQVFIPENTPIDFHVTSDSVMNSFWVPQLGGQIYAMPGMDTQLHLVANNTGSFYGSSANISGRGFAGMNFTAKSVSPASFTGWVHRVQNSSNWLNAAAYDTLTLPSQNNPVKYYSHVQKGLFDKTILKYMEPAGTHYMVMPGMGSR